MTANANVLTNLCLAIYDRFITETIADEIEALMVIGGQPIGGVGPVPQEGEAVHNDFYLSVNGQLFEDEAPEYAVYPYAVYSIPSSRNDYTFTEDYTNVYLQLFIYSDNMDTSEIKLIYRYASDLFDECTMPVTGSVFIWMNEENLNVGIEQHVTPDGTKKVLSYGIDFEVKTCLR